MTAELGLGSFPEGSAQPAGRPHVCCEAFISLSPSPLDPTLIHVFLLSGSLHSESASFVSPKWIPQLADSPDVMKEILPMANERSIRIPVLTPNMKGFERAVQSGAQEAVVFASASEGFSWKNTNCSMEDALIRVEEIVKAALAQDMRARG